MKTKKKLPNGWKAEDFDGEWVMSEGSWYKKLTKNIWVVVELDGVAHSFLYTTKEMLENKPAPRPWGNPPDIRGFK